MSEKLNTKEHGESLISNHETLKLPTPEQAEKLRKGEKDPQDLLKEARKEIDKSAVESAKPLNAIKASEKSDRPTQSLNVNAQLKAITLRRELNQIRRRLPKRDQALSKVIHQPAVRVVSEAAGKTVSRPSGMLGGGILALIGTTSYLILARRAGLDYNYFVFIALFIGGFILGLILELVAYGLTSSRRHQND